MEQLSLALNINIDLVKAEFTQEHSHWGKGRPKCLECNEQGIRSQNKMNHASKRHASSVHVSSTATHMAAKIIIMTHSASSANDVDLMDKWILLSFQYEFISIISFFVMNPFRNSILKHAFISDLSTGRKREGKLGLVR